jgi:DNA polymerase-3 subunit epsilon
MLSNIEAVKEQAINFAKSNLLQHPVYIDTETTGVERSDEIVEISIIDYDGKELFTSLVKPLNPIPAAASRIHGISNLQVAAAPAWPILWPRIRNFLFGRVIAAYNAPFDLRMMQQSHAKYRLPWNENLTFVDVMELYSNYRGTWDPMRRSMKFYKLEEAGKYFNIVLPNVHRSSADSLLTRAVLHSIAGISYSE